MKKYSDQEILRAKDLRLKKGYSFAHLERLTGIPATTIRNWCRGESQQTRWEALLIANDRKRNNIRLSEKSVVQKNIVDLTSINAKLFVSLLYWCEGSKYPATNKVAFANSDPYLMKTFIVLFRKAFTIDESKLRVHVQIHSIHDFNVVKAYWSTLLTIPESQFLKPTITIMRGGKHRKVYHGTCTVRYPDYRILLKMMGIYEEFSKRI